MNFRMALRKAPLVQHKRYREWKYKYFIGVAYRGVGIRPPKRCLV